MAVIGFDGTWNDENPKEDSRQSNVWRFLQACGGATVYKRGIGNDEDYSQLMQWVGGAFGVGGKGIVQDAMYALGNLLEQGKADVLDVIGFSRGAALALHFANAVVLKGVPLPSTEKKHRKLVRNPSGRGSRLVTTYTYDWKPVPVRWVGLWDTVPAMGIPGNDVNLGYRLGLPKGVAGSHAMALDVKGPFFILHRVPGAREVWFMGKHGEVGGSSGNPMLGDCTLRWMAREAQKSDIPVDLARIQMDPPGVLDAPVLDKKGQRNRRRRIVKSGDLVHRTVKRDKYPQIPWDEISVVN